VFGSEAERDGSANSNYLAFSSFKQYLSLHDLSELDGGLPKNVDPTESYTPRIAITLFLAHLLRQASIVAGAAGVPWPVPIRIARPAWDRNRAKESECILKSIVQQAVALNELLGPALSGKGGLKHDQVSEALQKVSKIPDKVSIFHLDNEGNASVLEATAVAAAAINAKGKRIVVVVDVGGGTSDFGAFMTGLPEHSVISEIPRSSEVLRKAGDHLDMLLRRFVQNKLYYVEGDTAALGVERELRRRQRQYKEELFQKGKVTIRVGDDTLDVELEAFIHSDGVKAFSSDLKEKFLRSIGAAVECARLSSSPRGRVCVEILFSGGGYDLPMVRALASDIPIYWPFKIANPDFDYWTSSSANIPVRQLVVAVGGAMLELPKVTAPQHAQPA